MCGIIGVFNAENANVLVEKGLKLLKERGKDGFGVFSSGKGVFGHTLHSVVGEKIKQPFVFEDIRFIANCEIYNWKELSEKYNIIARNDAELIFKLIILKGVSKLQEVIAELDGDFAFVFWQRNKVYVCRDIIGVKPVWYGFLNDGFGFASERKVLVALGFSNITELNPRQILVYDISDKNVTFDNIDFFDLRPELKDGYDKIKRKLSGLIINSIAKRIPDQKFGILFSGGVDSSLIAFICKKLGVEFSCYVAYVKDVGESDDLKWARKSAKILDVKLVECAVDFYKVPKYLKKVLPLIESNNVIKAGVGITFFTAFERAKKDGVKVIFSGLGAEDLFAGYERYCKSEKINEDCYSGLLKIYERDLYRDDVISMHNNIELRVPFLDKRLVDFAIKIPAEFKFDSVLDVKKKILRDVAVDLGLDKEIAFRGRKAAQYGSMADKAIEKFANCEKKTKSEYLLKFYKENDVKLGALFSSGKDSTYAMQIMKKQNYTISCLISLQSKNKDSYMFHTPNISIVKEQAKCLGIPLVLFETKGEKEKELVDLEKAIILVKRKYKIEGIVTGALYSNYQRERIEKICDKLGLKVFSPLWHHDQEKLLCELVENKFKVVISSIACDGLGEKWLGREIDEKAISELVVLNKQIGINIAGEGGEYESLVLDCPMFKKKIEILKDEKEMDGEFTGRFVVRKVRLEEK